LCNRTTLGDSAFIKKGTLALGDLWKGQHGAISKGHGAGSIQKGPGGNTKLYINTLWFCKLPCFSIALTDCYPQNRKIINVHIALLQTLTLTVSQYMQQRLIAILIAVNISLIYETFGDSMIFLWQVAAPTSYFRTTILWLEGPVKAIFNIHRFILFLIICYSITIKYTNFSSNTNFELPRYIRNSILQNSNPTSKRKVQSELNFAHLKLILNKICGLYWVCVRYLKCRMLCF
jgi:hypothetical protein